MTAVNDWAPPADAPGSPYSSFHGSWDTSQPWAAQPRPGGRPGARRAVIGVAAAVTALLVIAVAVIGFVLFVAGPAGAAGGCGGG